MAPRIGRRRATRYPFVSETSLFSIVNSGSPKNQLRFQVQNLSRGGVCLRGESTVKEDDVLRCEFGLPGLPVTIPTLMRVRWTRQLPNGSYLVGMQFMI